MEILQFTLLASKMIWRGRTAFFAINSNQFGKPLEFEEGVVGWDHHKEITRIRKIDGPTRKIFRTYLLEMLEEKLLVRIMTKDNRSKFYSITPLGIIHLMKSELFGDGPRFKFPDYYYILLTLELFAQQNVKPYKSIIFENKKFFNKHVEVTTDIRKYIQYIDEQINTFSNVDIIKHRIQSELVMNILEYYVTNGFSGNDKIHFATFNLKKNNVEVTELDQFYFHEENKPTLDYEQFDHYLANLMLCSLIYHSQIGHFDFMRLSIHSSRTIEYRKNIKKQYEDYDSELQELPEYFFQILTLFSRHNLRLIDKQNKLTFEFNQRLNKA